MSYCKDFYRVGQLEDCIPGIIGDLYSEYVFNDYLIQRHLDMQIYSQYDRETIAKDLFKQRLEMLVASSKSQLDTIQKFGWNHVTRQKPYSNSSQLRNQPVQRTIKKKNRRQKGSKSVHPYKAIERNNLVKVVDFNTICNAPTMKNKAISKNTKRILSDDYMYDELESHL